MADLGWSGRSLLALIARAQQLERSWSELAELTSNYHHLANQASIRRWELHGLSEEARTLPCPPRFTPECRQAATALAKASQGFHHMSNGYRYNKFHRVCDGSQLLASAWGSLATLRANLETELDGAKLS